MKTLQLNEVVVDGGFDNDGDIAFRPHYSEDPTYVHYQDIPKLVAHLQEAYNTYTQELK